MFHSKNLMALLGFVAASALHTIASAQLPADAIKLDKLKIPERIKSTDLDPVTLTPSDPAGTAWEYEGVQYRGSKPESKDEFAKDPAGYAKKAAEERWVRNFVASMSRIWCPVTDEVNPGGLKTWEVNGITWESCCAFCDESATDEDFEKALGTLKARALKSFELTGGKYVEGAESPIEGAVDENADGNEKEIASASTAGGQPAWLKGKNLKPTYSEGAGLVIEQRCVECHQPGGSAPMSFMSYGETVKWKKSLKSSVVDRGMPPWPADPKIGHFSNAKLLTAEEIDLLSKWADAGFPQGEGTFTPKPPAPAAAPTDVKSDPLANVDFVLPAGAEKVEVKSLFTFPGDGLVIALAPQSGRRCKSVTITAIDPAGKRTDLLSIPRWEPDYQYRYELAVPHAVAKGTVIEASWVFDNSKLNAKNPNSGIEVKAGDASGEKAEGHLEYRLK